MLRSPTPDDASKCAMQGNLMLDALVGAQVHLIPRVPYETGILPRMKALQAKLATEHKKALLIPVGGSNEIGIWGYIEAFHELLQQVSRENEERRRRRGGGGGGGGGLKKKKKKDERATTKQKVLVV